jgi:hypothetical protein
MAIKYMATIPRLETTGRYGRCLGKAEEELVAELTTTNAAGLRVGADPRRYGLPDRL